MHCPEQDNDYQLEHALLLATTYQSLLMKPLIPGNLSGRHLAKALFDAPFAVVSHDTQIDPVFNYANRQALQLFAMDWQEFTHMPSRLSAEPLNREARQHLLDRVNRFGFIDHYRGVRISKQGQRFLIRNAVVWNLIDDNHLYSGQAACFSEWEFL